MSNKQSVAQILVQVLEQAGVKHCYGIVGDTLNHVTEAIYQSQISWVHVRHEEVGAFAAGAESYLTGNLTACAGSCGPGSLHFINGIYEAQRNGAPLILIASQLASGQLGTNLPQEVDFASVYADCSVFCRQIDDPLQARFIITQAVQAALNQRGVAVIILPVNISQSEVEDSAALPIFHPEPLVRPNDLELSRLANLLNQGGNVTIYAGYGCKDAHDELIALAERLNAPIVHTSRAKDFVEYANPFDVGMTGMFGNKGGYAAVKECDTLLLLGCGFAWPQFYPEQAKIIQIDHDVSQLGIRHPIDYGLVGDVKATLQALLDKISQRQGRDFLDQHLAIYRKAMQRLDKRAVATDKGAIHPQYVVDLLDQYANDDALFTGDVGSAMVWLCRHIHTNGKRHTMTSLKHGTMANSMPQALGLQKAFPGRQVIAVCGDGGLSMLMGDLLTAIQEQLPIKIVVLNNSSLNFVELEQKSEGLVDRYTDLNNPNFAAIAQSIGFYAQVITDADALEEAIQSLLAQPGPALLDVHTSQNELVMPPNIEVNNVMGMALYGAKATLEGKASEVMQLLKDNFLGK